MTSVSQAPPGARGARLPLPPRGLDAAVAAIAFGLTLGLVAGARGADRGLDALGVVLAAAATMPLTARRRSPLAVFAATAAASAALNGLGYAPGPPFGPTVALYFVASDERTRSRLRETAAVVLGIFAVHLGATAASEGGFPTTPILFGVVVWGGAWVIGDQIGQRRQRLADLAERASRAERDTLREARLAAAEERTRIARDLHDSAAHAINVILVQAGAARLLQERDPAAVREALATIEDVARETIGDIDQLIRGLREDGAGEPIEAPAGLAALETLAARHRAAGLDVDVRIDGPRRMLAPRVDQAAYRIVQESLTNAARHGRGGASVEIAYGPAELGLTVTNALGPAASGAAPDGHGILGMRERAALLGGTFEAGARGGRFRVHARLPYAVERRGR
ncbi:MAG TPA: histidine kinase [Gaiellales bacterium]|nr:histidine kinase [Gaiellales bacterium]